MIPEKLIGFAVYNEGADLLGIVDATVSAFQALSETVKGAGLAGEYNSPTLGHYGSITVTLTWRTVTKEGATLLANNGHELELRGSIQVRDPATSKLSSKPLKFAIRGNGLSFDPGKLDMATVQGTTSVIEVAYIKMTYDGEEIFELDKFNYICKINGVDVMESVRSDLGK